jgi:hypothetical protein
MPADGTKIRRSASRELSGGAIAPGSGRAHPPVERWEPPYCGDIGLKIRADGVWLYQESPIRREALIKLFAGVLRKDADGRTYLVTPAEKVDVAVEDAPFLAVGMQVAGERRGQALTFTTNVGDIVACGPRHPLRFSVQEPGAGLKPYLLVRGRLEALLTRALTFDLVALSVEEIRDARPASGVWSGGVFFPMSD